MKKNYFSAGLGKKMLGLAALFIAALTGISSSGAKAQTLGQGNANYHSTALSKDGNIYTWGMNSEFQLGIEDWLDPSYFKTTPQAMPLSGSLWGKTIVSIVSGGNYSLALASDGTVHIWGTNIITYMTSSYPEQVIGFENITKIVGGMHHVLALKSDGTVYAWGYNDLGQLGNGTYDEYETPSKVEGLTAITDVACGYKHSLALKSDGSVYAWGAAFNGQLGNDLYNHHSTIPVQVKDVNGVGYLSNVKQISSGGYHSLALKFDGTVYAWGSEEYGELGNGIENNTTSFLPIQVIGVNGEGYLTGISQIAAGFSHTLALKSDGTVYAWGRASMGQLGDGVDYYTSQGIRARADVPVQVKDLNGEGYLTGVKQVSGGIYHSLALKFDGTVYAWGSGKYGQLGNGLNYESTRDVYEGSNIPVQVLELNLGSSCSNTQAFLEDLSDNTHFTSQKFTISTGFTGKDLIRATWIWGDGSQTEGTILSPDIIVGTHTYAQAGSYNVVLEVADGCGLITQKNYLLTVSDDVDGDGVPDFEDNCATYNPGQEDLDGDGKGDHCDNDLDPNTDSDKDGIIDTNDNCLANYNPGQEDLDGDGIGDSCDNDIDGDGVTNSDDCAPYDTSIYTGAKEILGDNKDNNCNGVVDEQEANTCWAEQHLNIQANCSDNPSKRNWKVYNPNSCAVKVEWEMHNTNQNGTFIAYPGESYFTTQAIANGAEVAFIQWQDNQGQWKKKGMAASSSPCRSKGSDARIATETQANVGTVKLSAYPSPFIDQLSLEHMQIKANTPVKVMLTSIDGRSLDVSSNIVEQIEGKLTLSFRQISLSNGLYLLSLEVAGEKPAYIRVLRQ